MADDLLEDPLANYRYWAAGEHEELGPKLAARVDSAVTDQFTSSIYSRWSRSYQYYFGMSPGGIHSTSQVLRGGDIGELAVVRVNHARALVGTLTNLITSGRIVWQPEAVNIDYDSLKETELAAAVLEYYWKTQDVAKFAMTALEDAVVFNEGYVLVQWEDEAGDLVQVGPEGGNPERAGDLKFYNISPWDIIRDPRKTSYEELDWVIVRRRKNKYDLMARHPDKASEIDGQKDEPLKNYSTGSIMVDYDTDDVTVYEFFHKSTQALQPGRDVLFLADGTILEDNELAYAEMPLYRVAGAEQRATPYGYSSFMDILGIQELIDSLHSSIASNQSTLGTQNIAIQSGTEIDPEDIAGGLKVIYTPPGQPVQDCIQPLQLTKTPGEVFTHLKDLKNDQQLILGLNGVVRGETPSGEMSGAALALLQSQAIQQSSTLQNAYLRMVENIGTCVLQTIQKRASISRKISIVGKSNAFLVTDTEYNGDSLGRIKKVTVEIGNPLSQTPAGRAEIAKDLLQMLGPTRMTPEQYLEVIKNGRVEPLTQSLNHELLLIKAENEALTRGEPVPTLALDDHLLHVREHRAVLANPEARKDPNIIQAVLAHISEHQQLYYTTDPATLAMVGQQPPMMPMMSGPIPGQAPPPGAPPPGKPNGKSKGVDPGTAQGPKPPSFPKNAATGQEWDAQTGGGIVEPKA